MTLISIIWKIRHDPVVDFVSHMAVAKPIYQMKVGKIVYQNLINQAEDFVYITTPYLIIDYDLTEDIKNAAMRGVDVRIVTPPYTG